VALLGLSVGASALAWYGRMSMARCRGTAGLWTIPRLGGAMSRKDPRAQTLCPPPGILATLGHTRHAPLLHKQAVQGKTDLPHGAPDLHQGVPGLPQEDQGLPQGDLVHRIVEALVVMAVIRQLVPANLTLLTTISSSSSRDSFHQLLVDSLDL